MSRYSLNYFSFIVSYLYTATLCDCKNFLKKLCILNYTALLWCKVENMGRVNYGQYIYDQKVCLSVHNSMIFIFYINNIICSPLTHKGEKILFYALLLVMYCFCNLFFGRALFLPFILMEKLSISGKCTKFLSVILMMLPS